MLSNDLIIELVYDSNNTFKTNLKLEELENSSPFEYVEKINSYPEIKQEFIKKKYICYSKRLKKKHYNFKRIFKNCYKRKVIRIINKKIIDYIIKKVYIVNHLL